MNNKILTLLGFASKAGKLSFGFDSSVTAMKTGKSKLIVIAEDISQKSRKEAHFFADKSKVKFNDLEGIDIKAVADAVGKKCGIISVNDENFAKACLNEE